MITGRGDKLFSGTTFISSLIRPCKLYFIPEWTNSWNGNSQSAWLISLTKTNLHWVNSHKLLSHSRHTRNTWLQLNDSKQPTCEHTPKTKETPPHRGKEICEFKTGELPGHWCGSLSSCGTACVVNYVCATIHAFTLESNDAEGRAEELNLVRCPWWVSHVFCPHAVHTWWEKTVAFANPRNRICSLQSHGCTAFVIDWIFFSILAFL